MIEVAPGQQFESVGRFVAAGKNVARINRELHYLLSEYGEARVYWPPAHQWVMIQDFPLPRGWSPSKTDIVILIPDNYGNGAPLRDCFVDADLRFRHNGKWQKIGHYFDTPGGYTVDSEFRDIGWRYLCLHMQDWRPEYTFFSYLKVIRVYLSNPYHSWPGN